jgi:hypothetical protein
VLGPRDAAYREPLGVQSLADRVWLRTADELADDPGGVARRAAEHVASANMITRVADHPARPSPDRRALPR